MNDRVAPNEFVVCSLSELPPGSRKIVRLRNMQVGLFNVRGEIHALHNVCPHQFGPACDGPVGGQTICNETTGWRTEWRREGEILICPWHGSEFDLKTGQCLTVKEQRIRRFPARVVDGEVLVTVGGARSAAAAASAV